MATIMTPDICAKDDWNSTSTPGISEGQLAIACPAWNCTRVAMPVTDSDEDDILILATVSHHPRGRGALRSGPRTLMVEPKGSFPSGLRVGTLETAPPTERTTGTSSVSCRRYSTVRAAFSADLSS
ncbi:hypothetical protein CDD83_7149 [Cordyceps sp. RAO-2017]|nr:hypothetical protein CDD83_7149 [Cordyceps sp. RAO-2017]